MADDEHDPIVKQLRAWADDLVTPPDTPAERSAVATHRVALSLAAVLVAAAAIAAIVIVQQRDGDKEVTPGSPATETSLSSGSDSTTLPATTSPLNVNPTDPTSLSTTTSTLPPKSTGGAVSYLSPPPTLPLREITTNVPFTSCCAAASADVGVGDQGVVLNQSWLGHVTTIGFDGVTTDVPVDGEIYLITYGPGDVVYGLRQGASISDFAIVAVAMNGDRKGTTVASAPLGIAAYMELPEAPFGHGATGIIDRVRAVNGTVIDYVDSAGQPLTWPETPPLYTTSAFSSAPPPGATVIVSTLGTTWRLDIESDPDDFETYAGTYTGPPPPAPGSDDRAVLWTYIGPNASPESTFGVPTMPVIAEMHLDGSVRWWSVPVGWTVVASDIWGTVLARIVGDSIDIALADW